MVDAPSPKRTSSGVGSFVEGKQHRQLSQSSLGQFSLVEQSPTMRRQSIMVMNGDVALKLSKQSSAAPKLYTKEHRDELLARLADIIKNSNESSDPRHNTTKGKLPIEAAYTVMKKVTEAAKVPIMPAGMSTFNRLESLRTDPALTLLYHTTWRDFFQPEHAEQQQQQHQFQRSLSASSALRKSDLHQFQSAQSQDELLPLLFDRLIDRVELLWNQLKISPREQAFFRSSLCVRPIASIKQCNELSSYIEQLEDHKTATKSVVQSIESREELLRKLYDVLSALQRKFPASSSNGHLHSSGNLVTGSNNSGAAVFWKEELICALDDLRCASLEVLRTVQRWRRALWRPHAFVYRGANYLLKMNEDVNMLKSDVFVRILQTVPLQQSDLQCILFLSDEEQSAGSKPGNTLGSNINSSNNNSNNNSFSNKNGAETEPFAAAMRSSNSSRRPRTPSQLHVLDEHDNENEPISHNDYISKLLKDFTTNIDPQELRCAAAVVLGEERLQGAIAAERAALKDKGVFIPLLRPTNPKAAAKSNTSSGDQNGTREPEKSIKRTLSEQQIVFAAQQFSGQQQ